MNDEQIKILADAINAAFGVTQYDEYPKFLEGIGIQLGFEPHESQTIPEAMQSSADTIAAALEAGLHDVANAIRESAQVD